MRLLNRNSSEAVEVQNASTADGGAVVQYSDWGVDPCNLQLRYQGRATNSGGDYGLPP